MIDPESIKYHLIGAECILFSNKEACTRYERRSGMISVEYNGL